MDWLQEEIRQVKLNLEMGKKLRKKLWLAHLYYGSVILMNILFIYYNHSNWITGISLGVIITCWLFSTLMENDWKYDIKNNHKWLLELNKLNSVEREQEYMKWKKDEKIRIKDNLQEINKRMNSYIYENSQSNSDIKNPSLSP